MAILRTGFVCVPQQITAVYNRVGAAASVNSDVCWITSCGDAHCESSSNTLSWWQGLRVEASGEAFWRWLGSSAAALPLSLWEAAAAQKLPTEVLAAADADRENHCRQAFSMVSEAEHCLGCTTFVGPLLCRTFCNRLHPICSSGELHPVARLPGSSAVVWVMQRLNI